MADILLPVNSDSPSYRFTIDLDGGTYQFEFIYNTRLEYWQMSIYDFEGNLLQGSITLSNGIDFLNLVQSSELPQGNLILLNNGTITDECGRDDLGTNCSLIYVEV